METAIEGLGFGSLRRRHLGLGFKGLEFGVGALRLGRFRIQGFQSSGFRRFRGLAFEFWV